MDDHDGDQNPIVLKIRWMKSVTPYLPLCKWLILNRGADIDSLLQTGHRPGVLSRVRFLKENPHCLQDAGSAVSFLGWADLAICRR